MKTEELFLFDVGKSAKYGVIAGCDEAGRGPLAGPVVCAAVIMPLDASFIDRINDSKQLSEKVREELFEMITAAAVAYGVSIVSEKEIDAVNILNATKKGMAAAINSLKAKADIVLVDAVTGLDINIPALPIIKGDSASYNIAAASILAKVTRDRIMRGYGKKYPQYLFGKNKGYGTAEHIEALRKFGKTEIHRESFLKKLLREAAEK